MRTFRRTLRVLCLLAPVLSVPLRAEDLSALAWDQRPGAVLPMDAPLLDGDSRPTTLRQVAGGLPLVLVPGYFRCPNLCGVVRDDLFGALAGSALRPGRDFQLAVLTIDPAEQPADAQAAREGVLARYPSRQASPGDFLSGPAGSLAAIARAAGFRARYDDALRQFLHPAGLVVVSPAGTVSGYLMGVGYTPADLEGAVAQARRGVSAWAQPVLMLCFQVNEHGRYTVSVLKLLRLGAVLTVLALGGTLVLAHSRGRGTA